MPLVTRATSRPSRRLSSAERREQLLDVTAQLVVERAFHGVSIEAVAQRAGITRALVYQHFGDLQGLLETVIERETDRALAQVSETTLGDLREGDPVELMIESLRAYLLAVQNQPNTWRLVLMPPEGAPEKLHRSIARGGPQCWCGSPRRSARRSSAGRRPTPS